MQFQEENNENDINVEELDYMGPAAINEVKRGILGLSLWKLGKLLAYVLVINLLTWRKTKYSLNKSLL